MILCHLLLVSNNANKTNDSERNHVGTFHKNILQHLIRHQHGGKECSPTFLKTYVHHLDYHRLGCL